jgi:hypothetical protein
MSNTLCTVPKLTLRGSPFNLPWGSSIYVKVIAFNVYGDSAESPVGNGAVILTNPDAPTFLIEVYADRTATALGISWTEGPADGGRPVLDYQVSFDQAIDSYVVLESGIILENFVAEGLQSGLTYKFMVQARNTFDLSTYSNELQLVCGFIPAVPLAPVTSISANQVIIDWIVPNNNGSPITSYRIRI